MKYNYQLTFALCSNNSLKNYKICSLTKYIYGIKQ